MTKEQQQTQLKLQSSGISASLPRRRRPSSQCASLQAPPKTSVPPANRSPAEGLSPRALHLAIQAVPHVDQIFSRAVQPIYSYLETHLSDWDEYSGAMPALLAMNGPPSGPGTWHLSRFDVFDRSLERFSDFVAGHEQLSA